jgi:hypothetical protein
MELDQYSLDVWLWTLFLKPANLCTKIFLTYAFRVTKYFGESELSGHVGVTESGTCLRRSLSRNVRCITCVTFSFREQKLKYVLFGVATLLPAILPFISQDINLLGNKLLSQSLSH